MHNEAVIHDNKNFISRYPLPLQVLSFIARNFSRSHTKTHGYFVLSRSRPTPRRSSPFTCIVSQHCRDCLREFGIGIEIFTSAELSRPHGPPTFADRPVFPDSSLSFIRIASDFYVSISKHARASSPAVNKASPSGASIFRLRGSIIAAKPFIYATYAAARPRGGEFYRSPGPRASSSLKSPSSGSLAPVIGGPRRSSLPHVPVKFLLRTGLPQERTCDLVVRFRKPGELGPP